MNPAARLFLILGAANAALVVVLGAFGAHGLKARLGADMMAIYQTGVQYHMFHALGLLAVGLTLTQLPESVMGSNRGPRDRDVASAVSMLLKWSGWLMLAGIVIFSGSLYVLSTTGWKWLGAVTPLGGLSFIVAWVLFTVALVKLAR